MYDAGYRKVYVYDDKTGTNPDKVSRTDWIAPWRMHAAPAMREKASQVIADLTKKTYLAEFVENAYSDRYVPSSTSNVVDTVLAAAFGNDYKKHTVKGVVGIVHNDVMDAVYEQVKDTIPRQFVFPTTMPKTDDTSNKYVLRNLAYTFLGTYSVPKSNVDVSEATAETMDALRGNGLTYRDETLLESTLDATTLTWDHTGLDTLAAIHADLGRVWEENASDYEKSRANEVSRHFYGDISKTAETPTEGEAKELHDALIDAVVPIVTAWVVNQWNMLLRLYGMRSDNPQALTSERITAMFAELERLA